MIYYVAPLVLGASFVGLCFVLGGAQRSRRRKQIYGPLPDRRSVIEISFGLTYRDSQRPVNAGEWLASTGDR